MGKPTVDWDPARRTHRGRLRVEKRRGNRGEVFGLTLVLVLKPTMADPTLCAPAPLCSPCWMVIRMLVPAIKIPLFATPEPVWS